MDLPNLPKIAWICGKDNTPDPHEFSEYLKDFYKVFHDDNEKWRELEAPHELDLSEYDAVLTRPKWLGSLRECRPNISTNLQYSDKFQVATLSVSDSKISEYIKNDRDRYNIITSKYGNIDSTAELAVYMAIDLRRRLNFHAMNVARGGWSGGDITKDSFGLKGSKWAIIGIGNLGSRILARLPGMGVESVKAHYRGDHYRGDDKNKAIDFVKRAFPNPDKRFPDLPNGTLIYKTEIDGNPGYDTNGKPISDKLEFHIEVSNDLGYVIDGSDVVVLALPYIQGEYGTAGFINMSTMRKLKKHAVFINVARAEIIDKEVYEAFFPCDNSGEYYFAIRDGCGFASDVLQEDIECKDPDNSKEDVDFQTYRLRRVHKKLMLMSEMSDEDEWKKLCWRDTKQDGAELSYPRLLLTPHIGSGTAESNDAVAREVLERLLAHFGIREKYEVFHRRHENGQYMPGSDDVLVLNDDEALLAKDLEAMSHPADTHLSKWVSWLTKDILPIYAAGGRIRMKEKGSTTEYPCRWNLEKQQNGSNGTVGSAKGKKTVNVFLPGEQGKRFANIDIDTYILDELSAYTCCGKPIALADWIRYTLWIFHSILVWFGDEWTLEKEHNGNWEELVLKLLGESTMSAS
jgi:phosphoglycerate dehydrogenase-like enzyme